MRIICFDPGHSTGVAVFDEEENLVASMTIPEGGMNEKLFRSLVMLGKPDYIVIERRPALIREAVTNVVHERIASWFQVAGYPIEEVSPGQWKGMVTAEKISGSHQIDAATMGRFWYRSGEKKDVQRSKNPWGL